MARRIFICVLFLIIFSSGNTWALFYNESLIYTGPPEYEEEYDYSENRTTSVNAAAHAKDAEASAGYWNLGNRFHNTWNSDYQGWIYTYAYITKDFKVTEAGSVSIDFAWDGTLQVTADSAYDGNYYLYAYASLRDFSEINNNVSWENGLTSSGSFLISREANFSFVFDEQDIGTVFSIGLNVEAMISTNPLGSSFTINDGDQLQFDVDFTDGLKITSITGAITAEDNGPVLAAAPVPVPSAAWLLFSGLAGLAVCQRKFRKNQ